MNDSTYEYGFRDGIICALITIIVLGSFSFGVWSIIERDKRLSTIVDFEGMIEVLRIEDSDSKCYIATINNKDYEIPASAYKEVEVGDYIIVYKNGDYELNSTQNISDNTNI